MGAGPPAAAASSTPAAQAETVRCRAPRPSAIVSDPRRGEASNQVHSLPPGRLPPPLVQACTGNQSPHRVSLRGTAASRRPGPPRSGAKARSRPRQVSQPGQSQAQRRPQPRGAAISAAAGMEILPAVGTPTSGFPAVQDVRPRCSPHLTSRSTGA
ncbi:hypothetical protein NDU88_002063 [Pleurodeles waltl]|uniref:Uncharacterized protein n=1 Tax=Pleurodeles waltl TaxID=8319 RepID=A0AAV7W146_PLEWA|nr:hypothetical protein NDU88_002063 [Pleurodeles waltl]